MGGDRALGLLNDMLWTCIYVAGPVLAATLLVGLLISVFQVTTQLQEMTLSYVPKILAATFMLIAIGPWMMGRVTEFARTLYLTIPTIVN
ncbi:flagellar biosynthetic protein FliQ [Novosphingobium fuchskuhlense]|uniref:Flagellar biosynthetic protein FliQ n=1 Tax=Novosphingobium fuchskuhlense TaxID=1117702 RepID=A0A117US87_9SPHN|nr:flagellar biosynthetic protein FliQ [Novosphingobium fuchskuhlense]KUR69911.1 flagellar biosynthetic protein FliQ [Novosphingobium fuchskuhlense]